MSVELTPIRTDTLTYNVDRFKEQVAKGAELPIRVLLPPQINLEGQCAQHGVLICGDAILPDLQALHARTLQDMWFVVATTQSHNIPVVTADLNIFTNRQGIQQYLADPRTKKIPYEMIGCGHFADPEIFYPEPDRQTQFDVLYVSKWARTKRIELLLQAAEMLPDRQFAIMGIPMLSGRKKEDSALYRGEILAEIDRINHLEGRAPNITVIEAGSATHTNPDGSVVPGGFTKEEMRALFNQAKMTVLLASVNENINRSVCEGLLCDRPTLIASDMIAGTPELVEKETGILVDPTGRSIANGIEQILGSEGSFHARAAFLRRFGIQNSNRILRCAIQRAAQAKGVDIDLTEMKNYTGDPWSKEYYQCFV